MSADVVARRIQELWGDDFAGPSGVVHVAAVGRDAAGGPHVMRIGPTAPSSATDGFALAVARARADAILTTGSILRAEPQVSHALDPDLLAWRREVRGKVQSPTIVVLTRGRDVPYDHPVLRGPRVLIATSCDAAKAVERAVEGRPVQVMRLADPSPRSVVEALVRRGCHDVCIEAGPSTASALYEEPPLVDELLLSIFEAEPLEEPLSAGAFLEESRLRGVFGAPTTDVSRDEASGRWRFCRYVRSS